MTTPTGVPYFWTEMVAVDDDGEEASDEEVDAAAKSVIIRDRGVAGAVAMRSRHDTSGRT